MNFGKCMNHTNPTNPMASKLGAASVSLFMNLKNPSTRSMLDMLNLVNRAKSTEYLSLTIQDGVSQTLVEENREKVILILRHLSTNPPNPHSPMMVQIEAPPFSHQ